MKQINLKEGEFEKLEDLFGIKFDEESRNAILVDESCDIMACAGSGKTTVLLAKLTLLADRMPFENNKGICVLTHTNVAIDEIRDRLGEKAEKLFKYPNFFGTIQTFVNQYLALPFLNHKFLTEITYMDDLIFEKLLSPPSPYDVNRVLQNIKPNYEELKNINFFSKVPDEREKIKKIVNLQLRKFYMAKENICSIDINDIKNLLIFDYKELNPLVSNKMIELFKQGIVRYRDSYEFANLYIQQNKGYADLFPSRFKYVFIDEMQDTKDFQSQVLNKVFPCSKVIVQKFGDLNQEILDFDSDKSGWHKCPHKSPLPLPKSKRFGENIANVVCDLRVSKDIDNIDKILGNEDKKETTKHPCIILYDDSTLDKVLDTYIDIIEKEKLPELIEKPKFYAISRIGKHNNHTKNHLSIFKYTSNYERDSDLKKTKERNIFVYMECNKDSIIHPNAVFDISINTILEALFIESKKNEEKNAYFNKDTLISRLEKNFLSLFKEFTEVIIEASFKVNQSDASYVLDLKNIFQKILKDVFTIETSLDILLEKIRSKKITPTKNIYKNTKNIPINLNTIHSSKGQTHTATLLLDSRYNKIEEFKYFKEILINGINTCTYSENDTKFSTKLAYVAMTRPTNLLCLAIHKKSLDKNGIEIAKLKAKNYIFYNAGEEINDEQ